MFRDVLDESIVPYKLNDALIAGVHGPLRWIIMEETFGDIEKHERQVSPL